MENYKNASQDIRNQLDAEAEAVQIILIGIYNDIYSIIDACPNACEMWKAIERLKQGESINVLDLETNLYWEFGKFTSWDGESLESYYLRFYKMMNELNEVNEIRAERLVCTANPLALVTQQQQPIYHPQNHPNHYTQTSSTRSQQAPTRFRGKAIVSSPPPTYDQEPTMVAEDDEMSKEKEIDKIMALISLSFKKIYKPTHNNLRTSSNTSRSNQDNSPRINRGTGYDNQRTVNVAGDKENVGTQVLQQSGIQCYNCKEYGHVARECQKPKWVKDIAYHKGKILLCKQEEAGFQLSAEQAEWRNNTNVDPDDQELEAHYMYMTQIQEVTLDAADNSRPIFDTEPLQKVQNDDDNYNVFANDREHPEQPKSVNDTYLKEQGDTNITIDSLDMSTNKEMVNKDDNDLARERYLLASLIDKLKCEINDSKNHLKAQLQDKDIAISELKKLHKKLKGKSVETKFEKPSVIRQTNAFKSQTKLIFGKPATFSDSLAKNDSSKSKLITKNDVSEDFSKPVTTQILPHNMKSILKNTNMIAPGMYKVHTNLNQTRTP
ncbi:retrovirus-related pol polyprotein from transposon TNT 1-94 [Tanacetum coccineum]